MCLYSSIIIRRDFLLLYPLLLFNRTREKSDSDESLVVLYLLWYMFFLMLTIFVGNDVYVPQYVLRSSKLICGTVSSKVVVKRLAFFLCKLFIDMSLFRRFTY